MKCKFLLAAAAALSFAACGEKISVDDEHGANEEKVRLEVNVSNLATRLDKTANDKNVYDIQIFVFDEKGRLESYEYETASMKTSFELMKGPKKVHVLCNAARLYDIKTYSDLCSKYTDYKENNINRFVMEGTASVDLNDAVESVTIEVKRIMSWVTLLDVKNELDGMYEGQSLKLMSVHLINLAGNRKFLAEGEAPTAPTSWYHKGAYSPDDGVTGLSYGKYGYTSIANGESWNRTEELYCYPNPTVDDSFDAETWTPRHTRLVVEAQISDKTYYYPITLPVLEMNTHYQVSLTITRPGMDTPDSYCEYESQGAVVTIKGWTDVDAVNKII